MSKANSFSIISIYALIFFFTYKR